MALGAAVIAIAQVRADGSAARERHAFERGDAIVEAIARRIVNEKLTNDPDNLISLQSGLAAFITSLVRPHADASGGVCNK
mgnify:CR=1 FL=1